MLWKGSSVSARQVEREVGVLADAIPFSLGPFRAVLLAGQRADADLAWMVAVGDRAARRREDAPQQARGEDGP